MEKKKKNRNSREKKTCVGRTEKGKAENEGGVKEREKKKRVERGSKR